ncbi:hypothetical protein [Streptomyces sp. XH2]|uniref:hypothetical protein n=1 Tax=Streptomyces sp. XH2 TaxID=3412483 RepID=UPI003C7D791D
MNIRRKVATTLATTVLALGGAAAMAPTASAAGGPGREACSRSFDHVEYVRTESGVNLRTGPGTGYSSRGLLYDWTQIYVGCLSSSGYAYVQVYSGSHSGEYGWVANDYITGLLNLD